MRKIFISLVWMLSCLAAFAQNWEGVKADSSYIWGEGWGPTIEEADQHNADILADAFLKSRSTRTG